MKSAVLITLFILLIAFSCSKDGQRDLGANELQGIWYQEDYLQEYNRISRLQYNFMDDNALEVLRIEISNEGNVLGYRFRTLGNYAILHDQISFFNLSSFGNDDTQASYSELDNLKPVNEITKDFTVTGKFEDNGNKIVLIYPPCGPEANCIGSIILQKERK